MTENQRNNRDKTCQRTRWWHQSFELIISMIIILVVCTRTLTTSWETMESQEKCNMMLRLCFKWSEGHESNHFFPCKNKHKATLATAALTPFSSPPSQQLVGALAWPLWHPICHRPFQFQPWQCGKFGQVSQLWQVHPVKHFTKLHALHCVSRTIFSHFLIVRHSPTKARVHTCPACTCFSTLWWAMSRHYAPLVLPGSANVVCWAPLQSWKLQSEVNQ